ncbi:hypothetical protein TCAL_14904 [Tigriopus californicus]|uniref:Uncharacterized protein n=1 Tax=Tigriopus californicus TaxID=6832 RepID=A0A553P418_TIGCA|nr:serine/arginine repetitive matrix protein 2-like [Tigriopus californicus]TRY72427.1 hypothetical protein TCAL_14904 [Tigriopus californicus]
MSGTRRPQRDCARQAAQVWQSLTHRPRSVVSASDSPTPKPLTPAFQPTRSTRTRAATTLKNRQGEPGPPAVSPVTQPRSATGRRRRAPRKTAVKTTPVAQRARRNRAPPPEQPSERPEPSSEVSSPTKKQESLASDTRKKKPTRKAQVKPIEAGDGQKLDSSQARLSLPPKNASPAQIQAFLASRPKLPVYRKANLLSGSKLDHSQTENDIYDVQTYGTEEFGPEPQIQAKKKKAKRRAKKQPGDIILTFGQRARENVAPILKEIKNLKTPQPVAKKALVRKPLNPVNVPVNRVPPHQSPATTIHRHPSGSSQYPPNSGNISPARSSFGYTRDCDDFMPSCHDHSHPSESLGVPPPSNTSLCVPEFQPNSSPARNSTLNATKEPITKCYKTPIVPRHVRKPEGKVSTPRADERHAKGALPDNLSTQELVKMAFGFDESSEDEELDNTENESLFGISPVRGHGVNNFMSPSASMIHQSKPKLLSVVKTRKKTGEPYRFVIPAKPNANRSNSKSEISSRFPSNVSKSIVNSETTASQAKRIDGGLNPNPKYSSTNLSHESNRVIPKPQIKVIRPPDENVSADNQSDPSLYGDIEEEISKIPAMDCSASVGNDSLVNPAGPTEGLTDMKENEIEDEQDEDEEEEGAPDAFTMLKNESLNQSLGKKACLRKRSKKSKTVCPVAKESPIEKATKQTLIYEMVPNATFGEKKQMKTNKRKISESRNPEQQVDLESEEKTEPREKKQKTGKTYCKRTINTSVTTSPVKKPLRKDKKFEAWATLQTSHFGEVEGFDLSFG